MIVPLPPPVLIKMGIIYKHFPKKDPKRNKPIKQVYYAMIDVGKDVKTAEFLEIEKAPCGCWKQIKCPNAPSIDKVPFKVMRENSL